MSNSHVPELHAHRFTANKATCISVAGQMGPARGDHFTATPARPKTESKPDDLQIGARLRHARLLEGIRIRELAERVGCAESMISKIENGKVAPSLTMLQRLGRGAESRSFVIFGADINSPGIVQKRASVRFRRRMRSAAAKA